MTLAAGKTYDLLSGAEHTKSTDRIVKAIEESAQSSAPLTRFPSGNVTADANGNISYKGLFRCPVGMRADIHRLALNNPAYTPVAPLSSGWIGVTRQEGSVAYELFVPHGSQLTVLPFAMTWTSDAPVVTNGNRLYIVAGGLPANTVLSFTIQVDLWDTRWPIADTERELA